MRIAHLDTGYDRQHETRPMHLLMELGRSFVDADRLHNNGEDPNNQAFLLDNSGHGTGTLGILAGALKRLPMTSLGGAPDQGSTVRIPTASCCAHSALAAWLQYAADSGAT